MTQAFTTMDNLKFNGDVRIWQTDAVSAIRELLDSQASIMHYMLTRVMHSFKGNLKTVQYQIADEINSTTIDDKYNIFDMVQNVATDIASVGDSTRTQKVNAVKGNGKRGSKKGGKKESSKGAGKESQKDNGKKGSGIPGVAGPGSQCHNCGEFGHFARDCTKPKKSFSAPAEAPAIQAAANSSQLPLSDQIASGLAALQKQLQAHSQCHVVPVASPYQNATGGWACRGQRIGEAKHPGPSPVAGYGRMLFSKSAGVNAAVAIRSVTSMFTVLSLCDGIGCAALPLKNSNAQIDRYVLWRLTTQLAALHSMLTLPVMPFLVWITL